MSVILHGPQGTRKPEVARALMRRLGMTKIVDDESVNPYEIVDRDPVAFKLMTTLYVTHLPPPEEHAHDRRVISIAAARAMLGGAQ